MIAADTSSLVAFLNGQQAPDVIAITEALEGELLILPPVVLSELLSAPDLPAAVKQSVLALPQLQLLDGYWQRVGEARAKILGDGKKARLADTMIAISCTDHDLPLIARDHDYRHFVNHCGLRLQFF